MEQDGTIRIAWQADGYAAIHVQAPFRSLVELEEFARGVADCALTNRSLADLQRALRAAYPGMLDVEAPDADAPDRRVLVRVHPPPGEPNPDVD